MTFFVGKLFGEVAAAFYAVLSFFATMILFFGVLMRFDTPHSIPGEVAICILTIVFCLFVSTASCFMFSRNEWKRLASLCGVANIVLAIAGVMDGLCGIVFFLGSFCCIYLFGRIRNGNGNLSFLLSYIFALLALGFLMHLAK